MKILIALCAFLVAVSGKLMLASCTSTFHAIFFFKNIEAVVVTRHITAARLHLFSDFSFVVGHFPKLFSFRWRLCFEAPDVGWYGWAFAESDLSPENEKKIVSSKSVGIWIPCVYFCRLPPQVYVLRGYGKMLPLLRRAVELRHSEAALRGGGWISDPSEQQCWTGPRSQLLPVSLLLPSQFMVFTGLMMQKIALIKIRSVVALSFREPFDE